MKKLLLTIMCMGLIQPTLYAANEGAHGGKGAYGTDGKLYLVDFIDSGLEKTADFGSDDPNRITPPQRVIDTISRCVTLEGAPFLLIAQKIAHLRTYDVTFANNLFARFCELRWNLVSLPLRVDDPQETDSQLNYIQLATRNNTLVKVSSSKWTELDDVNKAGLVFHELIYYAYNVFNIAGSNPQNVAQAMAYIFSSSFRDHTKRAILDEFFEPLFWTISARAERTMLLNQLGLPSFQYFLNLETMEVWVNEEEIDRHLTKLENLIRHHYALHVPEARYAYFRYLQKIGDEGFSALPDQDDFEDTYADLIQRYNNLIRMFQNWLQQPS